LVKLASNKKIMPQLDTVTFFNQLFWFTIVFFGFYFFVLGTIIPKLTLVLKARAKKITTRYVF